MLVRTNNCWIAAVNSLHSHQDDEDKKLELPERKQVTGIQLESWAREDTGRFRDVKRCVATWDRTRVSGIGLLRNNR